jgi:drug/metabolite transporter (DMT)-like permease
VTALAAGPAQNPVRGVALKLASVFLFTVMAAMAKAAMETAPVGQTVFFRSFFALPPILVWAATQGTLAEAVRVNSPRAHVFRGLVGVAAMGAGFGALAYLPLPEAIAIGYAAPLIATGLAALTLGETVRGHRWAAVTVGLCGVTVMLWPRLTLLGSGGGTSTEALGAALALGGAALVAVVTVQIRRLTQTETTLSIVFWFTVTCTLTALTTAPWGWALLSPQETLLLVGAGLLGGTAQILMTEGYRHADASTLAPFEYSSMVYGLGIGFLVFAEIPSTTVLIGAAVVIGAGLYIIHRERRLRIDRAAERQVRAPMPS